MSDVAEMYLADEVGYHGITDGDVARELAAIGPKTPVNLRINSPGGSVFTGLAIYNQFARHKAPVHVYVDGIAASIASVIAMAGRSVTMGRRTELMIHNPSGVVMGNSDEMLKMADLLDRIRDDLVGIYRTRAGGSDAHWRAALAAETWYSADEAVAAGLADKVAPAPVSDRVAVPAAVWKRDLRAEDVAMLGPWAAWSADFTIREARRARSRLRDAPPSPRQVTISMLADGRCQRQVGRGLTVIVPGRTS